ncbi:hypothetical protein INS49_009126 [Diaporthe citri]|uniref:uncharacterized protein n=1 Tax=Diaporthe citri TaxID=83186 RepID=UPI001C8270B4|nr:uncharacterized protein INS49_009126 [Diaporthe citri]KAG6364023.1 hypothetical protein INS49_009126 [Diaporthe citri]
MAAAPGGTDRWALFLRERRMKDKLRRVRNDFKGCYCPPGCRGGPQDPVGVNPASLPARPLHGPYVRADSDMPTTRGRTDERRDSNCVVIAEARGTSDIVLHRSGERATLRMSLQVHTDVTYAGRMGYYGEMFLTRHGQQEEFIGIINSWHVERTTDDWEYMLLDDDSTSRGDMAEMKSFFLQVFSPSPDRPRDRNEHLLPWEPVREHFAAPWAMLGGNADLLYIPLIWITKELTGQRIIDQGFELFFRLMTGGTLPEPYNLDRPLSVLLVPGALRPPYDMTWNDPSGRGRMNYTTQILAIARAYERNGFMRLEAPGSPRNRGMDEEMGRRVEPGDHPAAHGDVLIQPPDPPDSDLFTPSPMRRQRLQDERVRALMNLISPSDGREGTRPRNGEGGGGGGGGAG